MATYVYETIPQNPGEPVLQFEIKQSMNDAPLTRHPETGMAVRRVITGGFGLIGANTGKSGEGKKAEKAEKTEPAHQHSGGCCGGACGCSH